MPAAATGTVIDELDARLIELLTRQPRVGVLEASRRLAVARGTVQARLDRLQDRGVITGYGPDISAAALDHGVMAFVTLEIRQAGGHDPVVARLAAIPEVLEAHTITGAGDMLCRVVARTNADLQRVIDALVGVPGVLRTATFIVLDTPLPCRWSGRRLRRRARKLRPASKDLSGAGPDRREWTAGSQPGGQAGRAAR
jgi:DNA-binding Lrp family transcriptional regulator